MEQLFLVGLHFALSFQHVLVKQNPRRRAERGRGRGRQLCDKHYGARRHGFGTSKPYFRALYAVKRGNRRQKPYKLPCFTQQGSLSGKRKLGLELYGQR